MSTETHPVPEPTSGDANPTGDASLTGDAILTGGTASAAEQPPAPTPAAEQPPATPGAEQPAATTASPAPSLPPVPPVPPTPPVSTTGQFTPGAGYVPPHLSGQPTSPVPPQPAAAPATAPPASQRKPRPRTSPIVWGALILVFCAYVAVRAAGGSIDLTAWLITTILGLGALLLVVGVAVLVRTSRDKS